MRGVVPGLDNPLTIDESKRTDACVITLQTEDRVIREPKDVPQKHAKDDLVGRAVLRRQELLPQALSYIACIACIVRPHSSCLAALILTSYPITVVLLEVGQQ